MLGQSSGSDGGSAVLMIIYLAVIVLEIAAMWKAFTKAGQPGWAAIVPIYNLYVMLKIAGRPGWWLLLLLVPFVNFVVLIIAMIDIARNFGKGTGFGLGLAFLGFIFWPILAFGDAQYRGPGAPAPMTAAAPPPPPPPVPVQ